MIESLFAVLLTNSSASEWSPAPRELRGVWVATVDNIDWPSRRNLSTKDQQRELIAILDRVATLNLNTVIFQVRPAADALYTSKIEPWSEYLTGAQGRAPSPKWDPLAFAVDQAHRRGLQLHAWFNPYRAYHPSAKGALAPSHIKNAKPHLVRSYGSFLWMDPAEKEVQDRSSAVIADVVRRYDIDGIHLDDYFYPYPVRNKAKQPIPFPDGEAWAAYKASGGTLSRGNWRRQNVDRFIQRIYRETKRAKPWVAFGISPFGIYRPGVPKGIQAGIDQYDELYADVLKWLRHGWCDYLAPQLYWKIAQAPQSYPVLLKWWCQENVKGRLMVPGNFTSRLEKSIGDWPAQEIVNQVITTRKREGASGNIHFSMKALMKDYKSIGKALAESPYRERALPPAMPWLGRRIPAEARNVRTDTEGLRWQSEGERFAVYGHFEQGWQLASVVDRAEFHLSGQPKASAWAVTVLSRTGMESPPAFSSKAESR